MNIDDSVNPIVMIDVDLIDIIDQPMPEQSEENKIRLMDSIRDRGSVYPIVVEKRANGRYTVIDGRTRLEVMKRLGRTHIGCIYRDENEDPLDSKILPYELELCRRHLMTNDQERLTVEQETIKKKPEYNDTLTRKLSTEMRVIFKSISDKGEMNKELRVLFWMISRLPQSQQRAFFEDQTESVNNLEQEERIDTLNEKIDELQAQIEELKVKERALETLKKNFKSMSEKALKEKTDELEEKYKEKNLTGNKLAHLLDDERKKVADQYKDEILEMNSKMQELSKVKEKTQNQLDYMKDQLRAEEDKQKKTELILKKQKDELDHTKKVISTLANSQKITQHLQITLNDITSVYKSLTMLGEALIEDSQKEEIQVYLGKISDLVALIDDYITKPQRNKNKAA